MMPSYFVTVLLWTAALGSGLIAGIYFAFSVFVMPAFNRIDAAQSIAAMKAINETILHSLFMPLFFGSSIVSVLLIIVAFSQWGETGFALILTAGAVYFIGMFVCTLFFNVPLNNALAKLDSNNVNAHSDWSRYAESWTNWNHLRTVSSFATSTICIWILSNQ